MSAPRLVDHPTAKAVRAREHPARPPGPIERERLRTLCLEAGADDVGFVSIDAKELARERPNIVEAFPQTRSLISFVVRMNPEPIRSPARSFSNIEFHHTGNEVTEVGRRIVERLGHDGVRALNVSAGFPMEMNRFPGRIWTVAHKPIAVAAGMGQMGIHRNVIHPRFGNFILLGTVCLDVEITGYDHPIDFNPCLECKLCVAACPVGAIGADGAFNFSACSTHNYREFMGGFIDWVGTVADSKDANAYRDAVTDSESASMWQSLSFGANYKAAYCMAVCPAGEDVIGPYLANTKQFTADIVRPLQQKVEPVYVVAGSDAEAHVTRRFPHKQVRRVHSGLRPSTIHSLFGTLHVVFQRGPAEGLSARYHFRFSGKEPYQVTVDIRDQKLTVTEGLEGKADLVIDADSDFWLAFLAKKKSVVSGLLTRKLKLRGSIRLLRAFGRCFPS
jgi:NAD-dependent dihydropyrimidine dehydrogenase PreA subunit